MLEPERHGFHSWVGPSVCADSIFGKWLLWYNGRNNKDEYVGLAIHEGLNLISNETNN